MTNDHIAYSLDIGSFFNIKKVQRLRQRVEITLSEKSYLPKFDAHESDWVSRVAVPTFKLMSEINYNNFCSIGTGSGIDALAAIEILGVNDITLTDIHQEVIDSAINNVKKNVICNINVNGFVGDMLDPLLNNGRKSYDLIYENLPNIPLLEHIDLYDGQNSSTYIMKRKEILPEKIDRNLISLHSIALHQAKSIISKNGRILSSIGARIPIKDILYLADEAKYEGVIVLYTWKVQSEPDDVIRGYYHYEQQGYGPFHFYPINALLEVFNGVTPVESGEMALEIEQKLTPYRISVEEALKKTAQRLPIGHTVVVLQSTFRD
jgi:methylase of polypeptide subunit release factors